MDVKADIDPEIPNGSVSRNESKRKHHPTKAGNNAKRKKSSPPLVKTEFQEADYREDNEEDEEDVYCICKGPDTGRWMIGCDFCDDWFHGDCIGMDEQKARLVSKFACPRCREGKNGKEPVFTRWKRICRLPGCTELAMVEKKSKYCSDEHGMEFFKQQSKELKGFTIPQLSSLLNSTNRITWFRNIGRKLPELTDNKLLPTNNSSEIQEMIKHQDSIKQQLEFWNKRCKFLKLCKDRANLIGEDLAEQLGVKKRETCGMDELLIDSKNKWLEFAELEKLEYESKQGICFLEKRKCLKHGGWQIIMTNDVELQLKLCNDKLEKLDYQISEIQALEKIQMLSEPLVNMKQAMVLR